jgi:hypothetical protein
MEVIMAPAEHIECPKHGVLEFKVDQTYTKIEGIERDTKAILAGLIDLQNQKIQLQAHAITIFGADQQGGIVADVRGLKEDRALRNKIWAGILAFIAANLAWLWALISGKNGG